MCSHPASDAVRPSSARGCIARTASRPRRRSRAISVRRRSASFNPCQPSRQRGGAIPEQRPRQRPYPLTPMTTSARQRRHTPSLRTLPRLVFRGTSREMLRLMRYTFRGLGTLRYAHPQSSARVVSPAVPVPHPLFATAGYSVDRAAARVAAADLLSPSLAGFAPSIGARCAKARLCDSPRRRARATHRSCRTAPGAMERGGFKSRSPATLAQRRSRCSDRTSSIHSLRL